MRKEERERKEERKSVKERSLQDEYKYLYDVMLHWYMTNPEYRQFDRPDVEPEEAENSNRNSVSNLQLEPKTKPKPKPKPKQPKYARRTCSKSVKLEKIFSSAYLEEAACVRDLCAEVARKRRRALLPSTMRRPGDPGFLIADEGAETVRILCRTWSISSST